MSGPENREDAVKDIHGDWWYQNPTTASWYIWNGQDWMQIPGASPRIAPQQKPPTPKSPKSWSCLLTTMIGGLIALIIVGGITLVAFNFFPAYHIIPRQGDLEQIWKMGGFSLLVTILGSLMLNNGFRTLLPQRPAEEDDWLKPREKRGCGTILNGLGLLFFGFLFLTGGLIMMTVVFYQEVLPWLGF